MSVNCLTVVTWLWNRRGYRSTFTAAHVNALAAMVRRFYRYDVPVLCVTNTPAGLDPSIGVVADREDFANLPSPAGKGFPSCYRRLRLFEPDAARYFGDRFVSIDLGVVITGDLSPLWDVPDDFVAYRDPIFPTQYCGAMLLLRAGSRPRVWSEFDPIRSPVVAKANGFRGSDQAWISYAARGARVWGREHGVYSFARDVRGHDLPADARVVSFHGQTKPWSVVACVLPWIRAHYAPGHAPGFAAEHDVADA